ncbi:MAG: ABC transporter ATP-binding protein [Planctomycetaceae bacterium]|nr:ABC transporter ATP-binding protein [Planctomycetaceae bacterium]
MIAFEFVTLRAGAFALNGVTFEIPAGGYGVLMGKTGSGKTTILEAICGLRPVLQGRLLLAGRDVTALRPGERGIGYVPQDRALFQTMSVRENLAFAPSLQGWSGEDTDRRVRELADLLRIGPLLDRLPAGLSGGEAQRVALGRALAARPKVLLLDEPLSALDDETWEGMIGLLGQVRKATGVTTLHVTHRREEARRLADRVFVLADGAVRPAGVADLQEQAR